MTLLAKRDLRETQPGWPSIRISLGLLLVVLACGSVFAAQEIFGVSNGCLEIGLGRERGDLVRLVDAHANQNFAGTASSGAGLWELTLLPTDKTLSQIGRASCRERV